MGARARPRKSPLFTSHPRRFAWTTAGPAGTLRPMRWVLPAMLVLAACAAGPNAFVHSGLDNASAGPDKGETYGSDRDALELSQASTTERSVQDSYGFLAQDVEKIIPEIVDYNAAEDIYAMHYDALIPILVEAVKEQQKQIEELKALIKSQNK